MEIIKQNSEEVAFLDAKVAISDIKSIELLDEIVDTARTRIRQIGMTTKYKLKEGDKVVIVGSSRNGNKIGIVQKVNRTRAVVKIDEQGWNVPFSMIVQKSDFKGDIINE